MRELEFFADFCYFALKIVASVAILKIRFVGRETTEKSSRKSKLSFTIFKWSVLWFRF